MSLGSCYGIHDSRTPIKSALSLAGDNLGHAGVTKHPFFTASILFPQLIRVFGPTSSSGEAASKAIGLLPAGHRSVITTMWLLSQSCSPLCQVIHQLCLFESMVSAWLPIFHMTVVIPSVIHQCQFALATKNTKVYTLISHCYPLFI